MSPISNFANLIISRFNLDLPIDVDAAIEPHAELEECEWPHDCDGVAILAGARPKIFVKRSRPARRKRFTKAHELGHIIISWHLANVKCSVDPAAGEHYVPDRALQESEANSFASHLLVPDSLISAMGLRYVDIPGALKIVEIADVSAAAGVMALKRVLLPGYAFQVAGVDHLITSSGTNLGGAKNIGSLERIALRSGAEMHQGREVRWVQLADAQEVAEFDEDAESVLRDVLARARPHQDFARLKASIYGVVGGVLSGVRNRAGTVEAEQLLGILEYKFHMHDHYTDLMQHSRFRKFLMCRAVELANPKK